MKTKTRINLEDMGLSAIFGYSFNSTDGFLTLFIAFVLFIVIYKRFKEKQWRHTEYLWKSNGLILTIMHLQRQELWSFCTKDAGGLS